MTTATDKLRKSRKPISTRGARKLRKLIVMARDDFAAFTYDSVIVQRPVSVVMSDAYSLTWIAEEERRDDAMYYAAVARMLERD